MLEGLVFGVCSAKRNQKHWQKGKTHKKASISKRSREDLKHPFEASTQQPATKHETKTLHLLLLLPSSMSFPPCLLAYSDCLEWKKSEKYGCYRCGGRLQQQQLQHTTFSSSTILEQQTQQTQQQQQQQLSLKFNNHFESVEGEVVQWCKLPTCKPKLKPQIQNPLYMLFIIIIATLLHFSFPVPLKVKLSVLRVPKCDDYDYINQASTGLSWSTA